MKGNVTRPADVKRGKLPRKTSGNPYGALAQLVARDIRIVEVRGSTPLCSTKKSLLEPLSKSKVSGEDFFIAFRKASFPLIACIVPIVRQVWAL